MPGMVSAMHMDHRFVLLAALGMVAVTACSAPVTPHTEAAVPVASAASETAPVDPAAQGLAFAQAHCAACHGVALNTLSPLPAAPTFEVVANTPGLTQQSLRIWLRDSHNYPEIMNFEIAPEHLENLTAYMTTLQNQQ